MTQDAGTGAVFPPAVSLPEAGAFRLIWRSFRWLRPYWRRSAAAYASLLLVMALSLAMPQVIRWIVDRGITGGEPDVLGLGVLALLGLTLAKGALSFLQNRWVEMSSQGVAYDLRNRIHEKLSALSFSYHDRAETGQLLSRAVQDVERIRFLTGRATVRLLDGTLLLAGTAVALAWMNPLLALLSLLSMPWLVARALRFGARNRPLGRAIQNQLAVLATRIEQNLRGARVVKAFAQEEAEIRRFEAENERWFDLSARSARLQAVNAPLLTFIANAGMVAVVWLGGLLAIRGELTLGELVAFLTYLGLVAEPVRRLGMIIPELSVSSASAERVFEILDAESEVRDVPGAVPLPPVRGHVRFEGVSFAYFGRRPALAGVTFEAQPGQVVALLGATGSGKTTVINLLPRFYDPTEGRIAIDGRDLKDATLSSLRDAIGIVLQETTLFAATVRENIAFGRRGAGEAEILEAARAAQAHEFIAALPQGYDTRVGERGATLSGGQKQRVAIARALLKDPRILILDDATSSVDAETEGRIQQALEVLMRGRTCFVIAQRLGTVRKADLILVLEGGRIAARGRHEELLRTSGLYAEICGSQLMKKQETGGQREMRNGECGLRNGG